jgi:hypothetical protein
MAPLTRPDLINPLVSAFLTAEADPLTPARSS